MTYISNISRYTFVKCVPVTPVDVPFDRSILAFEIDVNYSGHAVAKAH